MKISCLIGSPRKNSNSTAIAARFTQTAASLGAQVETVILNNLSYRGCQGCMGCKTVSEKCVLEDDLAGVLESLKQADIVVMALPVYCSDVPGQFKCFIDRTYSYMKPNYLSDANPSRVPAGKKLVFILTQGAPMDTLFADVPQRYMGFLKRSMGFGETYLIRGVGVGGGGAVGVPDQFLQQAEELARSIAQRA
ncbi:MAG TPA: flavodoxin family protein [Acidobacteriota bacterium]|nr:flavodoxin family protein [Acidobacteriota bacterium]